MKDNGGSPITNYVIEKQPVGETERWETVSRFARFPEYEVSGLDEGHQYRFRVIAENEVGRGPPLETERSIVAQSPLGNNKVFFKNTG